MQIDITQIAIALIGLIGGGDNNVPDPVDSVKNHSHTAGAANGVGADSGSGGRDALCWLRARRGKAGVCYRVAGRKRYHI